MDGPWTESGLVPVTGGSMHWASVGSGPPLVLVPKVGGRLQDWNKVAVKLADDYRVIAIDPPGHGGSQMHGEPPYIVSQFMSSCAVMAVLDELGVETFAAAGNSMGGIILLIAAAFWPERVTHITLVSTSLTKPKTVAQIKADESAKDGIRGVYDRPFTYDSVNAIFSLSKETFTGFKASQESAGPWKNPSTRGVERAGPINYLARVKAPKLLIYGDKGAVYKRFIPQVLDVAPDARIEIVKDCGSFVHQDKPEDVARLLRDFLT